LEAEEGDWEENANGNHTLDIGVGRLPVKTKAEANDIVTKLISYHNSSKARRLAFKNHFCGR
jgi:hypothetical protein